MGTPKAIKPKSAAERAAHSKAGKPLKPAPKSFDKPE